MKWRRAAIARYRSSRYVKSEKKESSVLSLNLFRANVFPVHFFFGRTVFRLFPLPAVALLTLMLKQAALHVEFSAAAAARQFWADRFFRSQGRIDRAMDNGLIILRRTLE